MKEIHQATTRNRFVTAVLAGIAAAIPVTAMVPAMATLTSAPGIVQVNRARGSADELSASAPPQLWAPHGCGNGNCRNWGQYNNGCGDNLHSGNRQGCSNTWPNSHNPGTGDRPSTANTMAVI